MITEEQLTAIIKRLRKQGTDDAEVEVKECRSSLSKDIWETVSAFANTHGGVIILGLSERKGFTPVEGFAIERVCDQFIAGMTDRNGEGKVANPPRYDIMRMTFEESNLLVITIDELPAHAKPCHIKSKGMQAGSYKREDDQDLALSTSETLSLSTAALYENYDRTPVPEAGIPNLNDALVSATFERALTQTPRALIGADTLRAKLERLNFIDAEGAVTRAGLLAAGTYPQQFLPRLMIDVAVHPGTTKGGAGTLRFVDRALCEGTIGEMIGDAVRAIKRNLKTKSVVIGIGRVDELEIPEEVLREAVANALIHREYNPRFDGQAVNVDIFDDRIEVTNPGGLYGSVRKQTLASGISSCRNAALMRLMSLVPLPLEAGSPAEGNGSGIPMMIQACKKRGLEEPTFCPGIDQFKVILHRPSDDATTHEAGDDATPSGKSDGADSRAKRLSTETGERYIKECLAEHGELSTRQLQELTGMNVNQVRSRIRRLINAGEVLATAPTSSRDRTYRMANCGEKQA